jgi:hypothetical protein
MAFAMPSPAAPDHTNRRPARFIESPCRVFSGRKWPLLVCGHGLSMRLWSGNENEFDRWSPTMGSPPKLGRNCHSSPFRMAEGWMQGALLDYQGQDSMVQNDRSQSWIKISFRQACLPRDYGAQVTINTAEVEQMSRIDRFAHLDGNLDPSPDSRGTIFGFNTLVEHDMSILNLFHSPNHCMLSLVVGFRSMTRSSSSPWRRMSSLGEAALMLSA